MVWGIGGVRLTAMVSFLLGAWVEHNATTSGSSFIQTVGFLSLLSGMVWMAGRQGAVGILGGFLNGFGLGVTFSAFFWPAPPPSVIPFS